MKLYLHSKGEITAAASLEPLAMWQKEGRCSVKRGEMLLSSIEGFQTELLKSQANIFRLSFQSFRFLAALRQPAKGRLVALLPPCSTRLPCEISKPTSSPLS